jgi:flagellar protein FlbD
MADDRGVPMIRLHRIAHQDEPLWVNPDLVLAVESTPDTVVTLTTHTKLIVCETAEEVIEAIREWRVSILTTALPVARRRGGSGLALVRATAADGLTADPEPDDRRHHP